MCRVHFFNKNYVCILYKCTYTNQEKSCSKFIEMEDFNVQIVAPNRDSFLKTWECKKKKKPFFSTICLTLNKKLFISVHRFSKKDEFFPKQSCDFFLSCVIKNIFKFVTFLFFKVFYEPIVLPLPTYQRT